MVSRTGESPDDPGANLTPLSEVSHSSARHANTSSGLRRSSPRLTETAPEPGRHRKSRKVSRACDHCKIKKLRCTGTVPCEACANRGLECLYHSAYRRGRPPTPQASINNSIPAGARHTSQASRSGEAAATPAHDTTALVSGLRSRGSPDLETAEIEGQFFDLTSNLTFLHRAWRRFSLQKGGTPPDVLSRSEISQPLVSAGDKPFAISSAQRPIIPDRKTATGLFEFYFDQCVVTYRCLHRQYCESWLYTLLDNADEPELPLHRSLGHAKAALVLNILAIASLRQQKINRDTSDAKDSFPTDDNEHYFGTAVALTTGEIGLPRLESVQARILQVLYLLQASRMNQAWYVFGSTVPIVSALGLHRKSGRKRAGTSRSIPSDYIHSQCCRRTFWVVYTIDKYLAVVFGRPRLWHDDDIDQDYPDRINDEDMTPQGPSPRAPTVDCHVDSLIFHAKVARIIDHVSRAVYAPKPMSWDGRLASAKNFGSVLHGWRESLPAHLGTIRPQSLIPSLRREALALKLAYYHAVMHTNRPFLLGYDGRSGNSMLDDSVAECMSAAKMMLETVDKMTIDKNCFHAFWWMPYVTFCALAVVYVWEIQQKATSREALDDPSLFALAERCQGHLAQSTDSLGRRYSIILEELRLEARHGLPQHPNRHAQAGQEDPLATEENHSREVPAPATGDIDLSPMFHDAGGVQFSLNDWQAVDWLDLDSSAFGPFHDFESSSIPWDVQ